MTEIVQKETILKCLRNIAQRDTVCGISEPEEHTCWMAADVIEAQDVMIAEYETQLRKHYTLEDDICFAFPTNRYLDPPDGGDVSLPEQIGRMWKETLQQRARIAELEAALKPFAVTSDKIPDEWFPHECHWAYSMGPDDVPTVGDLRAARAALEDK